MARIAMNYLVQVTATGVLQTLAQIVAASNHRVAMKSVRVKPLGSTGASTPIQFDLSIQDDAGGLTDDSSAIVLLPPTPAETRQTTALKYNTATEPTTSTPQEEYTLHQQGSGLWIPQQGELLIVGGTRMGLRLVTTGLGIAIELGFHLEE